MYIYKYIYIYIYIDIKISLALSREPAHLGTCGSPRQSRPERRPHWRCRGSMPRSRQPKGVRRMTLPVPPLCFDSFSSLRLRGSRRFERAPLALRSVQPTPPRRASKLSPRSSWSIVAEAGDLQSQRSGKYHPLGCTLTFGGSRSELNGSVQFGSVRCARKVICAVRGLLNSKDKNTKWFAQLAVHAVCKKRDSRGWRLARFARRIGARGSRSSRFANAAVYC